MKIITAYPITIQTVSPGGFTQYSNIDGNNTVQVQQFQKWANAKYSAGLKEDGVYGHSTRKAYNRYGKEWEGVIAAMGGLLTSGGDPTKVYSATSPSGQTKAGYVWDKVRGGWVQLKEGASALGSAVQNVKDTLAEFGIGSKTKPTGSTDEPVYTPETPNSQPAQKSSLKSVLVPVGIVAGVGLILYFALKGSNKTTAA